MSYFQKVNNKPVAVGIIEQTVIAPFSGRGEDAFLLVVENLSLTETFEGYAWSSPNGTNGWVVEDNDAFVGILPGKTRRLLLPQDRIWVRLLGNFVAGPATVRVDAILLHLPSWNPNEY